MYGNSLESFRAHCLVARFSCAHCAPARALVRPDGRDCAQHETAPDVASADRGKSPVRGDADHGYSCLMLRHIGQVSGVAPWGSFTAHCAPCNQLHC